jgi:hypothetical protein
MLCLPLDGCQDNGNGNGDGSGGSVGSTSPTPTPTATSPEPVPTAEALVRGVCDRLKSRQSYDRKLKGWLPASISEQDIAEAKQAEALDPRFATVDFFSENLRYFKDVYGAEPDLFGPGSQWWANIVSVCQERSDLKYFFDDPPE